MVTIKDLKTFGKEVRRLRLAAGLSQIALAEKIGCSNKQLDNIEWARCWPSMKVYISLCRALGMENIPLLPAA
jgi:transcriptional regulator with XRE-family HTH domain